MAAPMGPGAWTSTSSFWGSVIDVLVGAFRTCRWRSAGCLLPAADAAPGTVVPTYGRTVT